MRLRLLLDECVESKSLIRRLRESGHDVVTASSVGLKGRPDPEIAEWAAGEGRAVLTQNGEHFRALVNLLQPRLTCLGMRRGATPREHLSDSDVLTCLRNLEQLQIDCQGVFIELHEWKR